ncbi:MAG: hypothetical protein KGQ49_03465 [Verrucomicrobia bacterium]|nr:hypothetical protein [Verrucomicrobiota bacterium]MBU6446440.1 hypothetical protein [Verrucomicrobiota bacterium]
MKRFLPLFLFVSCAVGGRVVTMDAFYEVDLCTTVPQVVALLGKPYAIYKKGDGCVEYEYIERIKIGGRDAEERRYYIMIRDGVVISKRVKQSSPLPYGFDSYDMQTTQKDEITE